jgi:hypothetical protein
MGVSMRKVSQVSAVPAISYQFPSLLTKKRCRNFASVTVLDTQIFNFFLFSSGFKKKCVWVSRLSLWRPLSGAVNLKVGGGGGRGGQPYFSVSATVLQIITNTSYGSHCVPLPLPDILYRSCYIHQFFCFQHACLLKMTLRSLKMT